MYLIDILHRGDFFAHGAVCHLPLGSLNMFGILKYMLYTPCISFHSHVVTSECVELGS